MSLIGCLAEKTFSSRFLTVNMKTAKNSSFAINLVRPKLITLTGFYCRNKDIHIRYKNAIHFSFMCNGLFLSFLSRGKKNEFLVDVALCTLKKSPMPPGLKKREILLSLVTV